MQMHSERQRISKTIAAFEADERKTKESLRGRQVVSGEELRQLSNYSMGMRAKLRTLEAELERIRSMAEMQTKRVMEADRQVKVLLEMRATAYQEWLKSVEKEIESVAHESFLSVRHGAGSRR